MGKLRTLGGLDLRDRRVLLRVDFNVPMEAGVITDDARIRGALPTIRYLLDRDSRVVICSHLGRPGGRAVARLSLRPAAAHLERLLGKPVAFVGQTVGPEAAEEARALGPGELLLLENTRFHPQETANRPEFARELAALADVYVNDAFGTIHRAHASTEGVAHHLPSAAGMLLDREVQVLEVVLKDPARPFVVVLGGAKISDKIGVISSLIERTEALLIGGGMANTFLAAQGFDIADSLVDPHSYEAARELSSKAGAKLHLPTDALAADSASSNATTQVVNVGDVPGGWQVLDIGPRTLEAFSNTVRKAGTVFWNGPMGVFELAPFAAGTVGLATAIAESDAVSIVGGGDSAAAVRQAGLQNRFTHLSTGGGAALAFLEGKRLPGLEVLQA
ncbi:MAG: phosphoglycerate kinase [Chloroflexi bacterium]|nr:phosphoglycerate kinase [Chloroflexota bacterium]MDK1045783.1 phosphoglycerate kinase [Anaerolineales bacterium]MCH8339956.1 phosphoglycerate kinase [Chloroflexota bacterium]MCH8876342.1 phosphoglycerate kinase [Chloroflexota bacterium]MCI0773207.1 phosphoglycerate kinase [Chloroflexota bacterium]